mmetsp:Transcript_13655/g.31039  ORF Transcript_13655/g.31039 Transcript_13655/m.31039 type:complete len:703 (+) Transcript_13655:1410-3518(+)
MGKAIGAVEKHSVCKGTPNESAIVERVSNIKEKWQASVKARKSELASATKPSTSVGSAPTPSTSGVKREVAESSPTTAKRTKVGSSSFSSLMKKVSSSSTSTSKSSDASTIQKKGKAESPSRGQTAKKKSNRSVKWADHFGENLESSRIIEGGSSTANEPSASNPVSWTDRKKRDRAREKELLASVKKVKLLDDEDIEPPRSVPTTFTTSFKTTMAWVTPALLPERSDVSKPVLSSPESGVQTDRTKVVPPANYFSDADVPPNPAPLSDVEQALDMTSQSSAVVGSIPFFVPQQPEPAPAPSPVSHSTPPTGLYGTSNDAALSQQQSVSSPLGATPELVQALGLPAFLVGQDVTALQTLASSPGLLSTMLDSQGMYDQNRLLSLVQTLSGSPSHADSSYATTQNGSYMPPSYNASSSFTSSMGGGQRSRSGDEGNLHIAGYGPGTTQTDIITMFLPYVKVDEVVMKGTFAFVNTSDPPSAQRAREALQGTLLNGMPIRINAAQRKAREGSSTVQTSSISAYGPSTGGFSSQSTPQLSTPTNAANPYAPAAQPQPPQPPPPPQQPQQQGMPPGGYQNVDHVRDDRGNPATKNLFVAGYGPGVAEEQLRDLFNQHAKVVGVVLKGNFTFVNTAHKAEAVRAREMLQGQNLNGGPLRINFAKETGRLGTSFDLTYNERSGPNAPKRLGPPPRAPGGAPSYYGRGY